MRTTARHVATSTAVMVPDGAAAAETVRDSGKQVVPLRHAPGQDDAGDRPDGGQAGAVPAAAGEQHEGGQAEDGGEDRPAAGLVR